MELEGLNLLTMKDFLWQTMPSFILGLPVGYFVLKTFFKKYGHYDSELILKATQKYVESFGDSKQLMRTCIYFISKDDSSDLLTIMENIDDVKSDTNNELWTTKLM